MGETPGAVSKKNNAFNAGVSTSEVEIRPEDADLDYQLTAQALEILSGSTDDDGKSTGTLTLSSAVAITAATGTITIATPVANTFADGDITCASVLAADTVTVNGLLYTAVSGAKANDTEFSIDTGDNECATDLADSITNDTRSGTSGDQTATSSTDTVTAVTDVTGTGGNAITLVSSNGTRLAVTGSGNFTGGVTADTVTVNGLVYTAVVGAKANDTQFSIDSTDTATATDLADSIDDDTRSGTLNDLTAISAAAIVTATQTVSGTGGNATTLISSDGTRLAVSGSGTFTGGLAADVATVNGLTYTGVTGARANDTQFSVDTSDTAAASDLTAAINADIRTPITVPTADVVATSAVGVVTINQDGIIGDLVDISGTSNITASGATLSDVGTGARTVLVEGLDATLAEISETAFLNGTAVVALSKTYLRVNKATVTQVGTGLMNAGLITVRLASGGAIQITIPISDGVSQVANFTTPLGKEISIKSLDYTVESAAGEALVVTISLFKKLFNSGWELVDSKTVGNGPQTFEFNNDELEMPQRTDIKITAIKLNGTGDARVDASYGFREYNKI